jgi:hypothetical protein
MPTPSRALILAVSVLPIAGCGGAECGDGTTERDGVCVPAYPERACGEGTIEQGGVCVPAYPERTCGPSTVEVDGHCVLAADVGPCGAGSILHGGECVAAELQWVSLPFPAGQQVTITQGFNGYFSHHDAEGYAVDFPVPEGTTIAAARGGVVWWAYDGSSTGCADESCADQGNFVIVDHGDATFGVYYHLQHDGALVAPGDEVCQGQAIGRSGNTGWSSEPHLHFAVEDLDGQSLPLVLAELEATSDGIPVAGGTYTSQNAAPAACDQTTQPSSCPRDFFEYMGVELTVDVPCSVAERDESYAVAGRTLVPNSRVMIARWLSSTQDWSYACTPTAADGTFSTTLSWPSSEAADFTNLMIAAADSDCFTYQGWNSSPPLVLK